MRVDSLGTSWKSFWSKVGRFLGGLAIALAGFAITLSSIRLANVIPGGGFVTQFGFSLMMYGGFMMASVFDSEIEEDMRAIGWNPFNTNEELVINANKVSFYKGVPTFWVNKDPNCETRSGSFLGIWLFGKNNADDIRHEYGHTIQQGTLGWAKYLLMIGLPSFDYWGQDKWGPYSYYMNPWDGGADYFGGVDPSVREGSWRVRTKEDEKRAKWYLAICALFWPAGFFFLI